MISHCNDNIQMHFNVRAMWSFHVKCLGIVRNRSPRPSALLELDQSHKRWFNFILLLNFYRSLIWLRTLNLLFFVHWSSKISLPATKPLNLPAAMQDLCPASLLLETFRSHWLLVNERGITLQFEESITPLVWRTSVWILLTKLTFLVSFHSSQHCNKQSFNSFFFSRNMQLTHHKPNLRVNMSQRDLP